MFRRAPDIQIWHLTCLVPHPKLLYAQSSPPRSLGRYEMRLQERWRKYDCRGVRSFTRLPSSTKIEKEMERADFEEESEPKYRDGRQFRVDRPIRRRWSYSQSQLNLKTHAIGITPFLSFHGRPLHRHLATCVALSVIYRSVCITIHPTAT